MWCKLSSMPHGEVKRERSHTSDRVKFLLDMDLSPTWVMVLEEAGFEVLHWSKVGKPSASDHEIFDWAASNGYVIITHNGLWDHSRAFLRSRSFSSANSGKRPFARSLANNSCCCNSKHGSRPGKIRPCHALLP